MFDFENPELSVTVSGGSALENKQLCTAIAIAMRMVGFRNTTMSHKDTFTCGSMNDQQLISYMHAINQDLFDSEVAIRGESEEDIALEASQLMHIGRINPFMHSRADDAY